MLADLIIYSTLSFQIKDMMAAAQKMIQERKAQLTTVMVCRAVYVLHYLIVIFVHNCHVPYLVIVYQMWQKQYSP